MLLEHCSCCCAFVSAKTTTASPSSPRARRPLDQDNALRKHHHHLYCLDAWYLVLCRNRDIDDLLSVLPTATIMLRHHLMLTVGSACVPAVCNNSLLLGCWKESNELLNWVTVVCNTFITVQISSVSPNLMLSILDRDSDDARLLAATRRVCSSQTCFR